MKITLIGKEVTVEAYLLEDGRAEGGEIVQWLKRGGKLVLRFTRGSGVYTAVDDFVYRDLSQAAKYHEVRLASRGLGDTVAKALGKLGIPKCPGCKDRQEWLNKAMPFKKSQDPTS